MSMQMEHETLGSRLAGDAVYSAQEERALITRFLGGRGIFVEVGAYDPVFQSQTLHLELMGWKGLLVEPVPGLANNLRAARKADVAQVACVAPEAAGIGRVALLERRGNSTIIFNPSKIGPEDAVLDVPAATLDAVLERAGLSSIDYISVDVEGAEPEVLRGLTLKRFQPKLVVVDDRARFGETRAVMRSGGYCLVRRTGHNAWFVPLAVARHLSWQAWAQLAWTYSFGRFIRRRLRSGLARTA
ncbi:FkbM family methyltransferase [Xanthobacter autotrophicus]|uniref:FkbM family methyltransferase n=1 Tax=Xanthobacter dioxanivorans TaxID=2528964 RepID=A0A974PV82_9HYPH|nr:MULTISPECIES: FkbM family methyltransferase [Xanthobacter]QRG10186.1 FkbM family methyltransferase [Xanthobacter dioxanivorans]UDQ88580.1 FkbM family methyltransferase [Xanthobacter autotrophicus]